MNYPGIYGPNEERIIHVMQDSNLQANNAFSVQIDYDKFIVGEQEIQNAHEIPAFIMAGDTISWSSDGEWENHGWQICLRELESPYLAVNGNGCEVDDQCVQSLNYPEPYNGESVNPPMTCRIEAVRNVNILSGNVFPINVPDDVLTFDGDS